MFKSLMAAFSLTVLLAGAAWAQGYAGNQFTAGQGSPGTTNPQTQGSWFGPSAATGKQNPVNMPTTSGMPYPGTHYAPGNISGMWWGGANLPVTNMDSLVAQSGYDFDIYGDEGVWGPPPLFGFNFPSTIEQGIENSSDNSTLTTGHRSALPSAWLWTTQP